MVSSIWQRAQPLGQFALDEMRRPVGGPVANVEIQVVHLDVPEVMGDYLGHRPWGRRHDGLAVPQPVIECLPNRLELFEGTLEVVVEFRSGPTRSGLGGQVWVVSLGVKIADLARWWAPRSQT